MKWAFPSNTKRPLVLRCTDCAVRHGAMVFRLKRDARQWWPGPEQPPWPDDYHPTPQVVDLMASERCSYCVRQTAKRKGRAA